MLIAVYALVLALTNSSAIIITPIKTSIIGKNLATDALNAYTITTSLVTYTSFIIYFYVIGMIAQISASVAKEEHEMVSKRVTLSITLGLLWGLVLGGVLYLLKRPLLLLYGLSDNVLEVADLYYNYTLLTVPILTVGAINSGIMVAFQSVFLRMLIEIIAGLLDVGFSVLFLIYLKWGLNSVAFSTLICRGLAEIIHFIYILQPRYLKQYNYFKAESWRWWKPNFRKTFVTQSGFLIGRGILVMSQYSLSPILVSQIGGNKLAAYSIGNTLYIIAVLLPEALGSACNIKGSEYLAKYKFSYFRRLVQIAPLLGLSLTTLFALIVGTCYKLLFPLFTSDVAVLNEAFTAAPAFVAAIFMGGIPGVVESLLMSKQYFGYLCAVMAVSFSCWVTTSIINIIWLRSIFWSWIAMCLFAWSRGLGSALVVFIEEWKSRSRADGPPPGERGEGVIPLETGERQALLINSTDTSTTFEGE